MDMKRVNAAVRIGIALERYQKRYNERDNLSKASIAIIQGKETALKKAWLALNLNSEEMTEYHARMICES